MNFLTIWVWGPLFFLLVTSESKLQKYIKIQEESDRIVNYGSRVIQISIYWEGHLGGKWGSNKHMDTAFEESENNQGEKKEPQESM